MKKLYEVSVSYTIKVEAGDVFDALSKGNTALRFGTYDNESEPLYPEVRISEVEEIQPKAEAISSPEIPEPIDPVSIVYPNPVPLPVEDDGIPF